MVHSRQAKNHHPLYCYAKMPGLRIGLRLVSARDHTSPFTYVFALHSQSQRDLTRQCLGLALYPLSGFVGQSSRCGTFNNVALNVNYGPHNPPTFLKGASRRMPPRHLQPVISREKWRVHEKAV